MSMPSSSNRSLTAVTYSPRVSTTSDPSRADVVTTRGEYVTAVKERFDEEGIDLPYPHRTLTGGIEFADGPVATAE